jgi:glycosyltransferase involved in cell wall biosynthesis
MFGPVTRRTPVTAVRMATMKDTDQLERKRFAPDGGPVFVIGPFPPPVHGMAVVTEVVAKRLEMEGRTEVVRLDLSTGGLKRDLVYHLTKIRRVALAALALWSYRKVSRSGKAYIAVDSGKGMYYTLGLAALARKSVSRVLFHHHSSRYINRPRSTMRFLCRVAGEQAAHVTTCRTIGSRFESIYGRPANHFTLSNATLVPPGAAMAARMQGTLNVGHYGNLGVDKGLDLVFATTRDLIRSGVNVQLVLGGPTPKTNAGKMLTRAQEEFGQTLLYLGPITDDNKQEFFSAIDVFLFPSRLTELQPIVVLEAMAHGAVPIAFGHGCIPSDFGRSGGVSIPIGADFVAQAVAWLRRWDANRAALRQAQDNARARHLALRDAAAREWKAVLEYLSE